MISKTVYLGERPIYGDWSNGSFSLWQQRMVYPIDEYGPPDYSVEIDLLQSFEDSLVFKFVLDCVLDRGDADFDEDLLFCLNILQENTGSCDIDRSDKKHGRSMSRQHWSTGRFFSPGSIERFLAKAKSGLPKSDSKAGRVVEERVAEFRRLSPEGFILGKGGFNRYIGAVLPHDIVVF